MTTAKKDVTGNRVQGRRSDDLDRLLTIAAEIADQAGLLDEDLIDLPDRTDGAPNEDSRGPKSA